jgi:disulfide bond formation protein DsbB
MMLMSVWQRMTTYRMVNIGLFLASVVGMAFALYLQHVVHLDPCPLCIFQRVGLMVMGLFALIAAIHSPRRRGVRMGYSLLATLGIIWSVGVAARHVWLQHLPPDDVPACGPGLDYWLEVFPMQDVIQKVLHGSGECAKVDWTMLGWSLPHWALLFFVGLLLVNLWQLLRKG